MAEDEDQIYDQFLPFFRAYKSGRIERLLGNDVVPAGDDPITGVSTKDVDLFDGVSARLFLPKRPDPSRKIPVVVFFHGGIFIIESPFSPSHHAYHTRLAAISGALIVSVHYRRAPEHPLPIAFEDSWAAVEWVAAHAAGCGPEPWLTDHGDFTNLIVAGDSAGATIAQRMALRAGEETNNGVKLAAAILVQPYFWGAHELGPPSRDPVKWARSERMWRYVCPTTTGADDPLINPLVGWPEAMAKTGCGRLLVCVAEKDKYREWGLAYYKGLTSSGWRGVAELFETPGESHIFHVSNPGSENATALMQRMADFINYNSAR